MTDPARIDELETRLAFQEKAVSDLNDALIAHHQAIASLEAEVERLKTALTRLSAQGDGEILGAMGGDDPVPSSG